MADGTEAARAALADPTGIVLVLPDGVTIVATPGQPLLIVDQNGVDLTFNQYQRRKLVTLLGSAPSWLLAVIYDYALQGLPWAERSTDYVLEWIFRQIGQLLPDEEQKNTDDLRAALLAMEEK